MDCQVLGGSYQEEGIIPEVPQASVAAIAQKSANVASDVIVVDGELL
jgi:hypothetical protein